MDEVRYDHHVWKWARFHLVHSSTAGAVKAATARLEAMPSDRIERLLEAGLFDRSMALAAMLTLRRRGFPWLQRVPQSS